MKCPECLYPGPHEEKLKAWLCPACRSCFPKRVTLLTAPASLIGIVIHRAPYDDALQRALERRYGDA